MEYTGAQIIITLLERYGIDTIAGIPGGSNLPLYDALHGSTIRHILARHEQGAGFIAQGMARSTGKPAVCFATSGPGATNMLTAIADAKLDSVPIIIITGQVPLGMIGTDAFQEVDTIGMSLPVTKHNFLIRSAGELLTVLPEAFRIAASDRPGPVLIDVPKDIQLQQCAVAQWPDLPAAVPAPPPDAGALDRLAAMIDNAQRPLLLAGGGVIHADASGALRALSEKGSIPVAATLMGLGALPADDPLFLGMIGMHGAASTNRLAQRCDLLIAVGARFDDRATGRTDGFCPDATIVHIDIDPSEFGKIKQPTLSIVADCTEVMTALLPLISRKRRSAWRSEMASERSRDCRPGDTAAAKHPAEIIRSIATYADPDAIITTDVGQHQMWVAQYYPFSRPRTLLTSGGLGTMGFGLPAAIGAALANPEKEVLCFTGDGSLMMNIQELATLAELRLNIRIILFNNRRLGLVHQQQEFFYNHNFIASNFPVETDFCGIARGFGIEATSVADHHGTDSRFAEFFTLPGPVLISIDLHPEHRVLPMVPPGAPNHIMIGV
jgi:acetolactate synthase-1/2/3 large subunit